VIGLKGKKIGCERCNAVLFSSKDLPVQTKTNSKKNVTTANQLFSNYYAIQLKHTISNDKCRCKAIR